ncbi:MAG: preprotein translocase subunit YajC [Bdellovibrionota bacterium]
MNFFAQQAFADTTATPVASTAVAPAAPIAAPQPSAIGTMLPFALMAAVFYFLMIRPQQKKVKDHESLLNTLQKGEEVITRAGIIGKIHGIAEKFITLEVDQNVRIKILKSQIETVLRTEQKA